MKTPIISTKNGFMLRGFMEGLVGFFGVVFAFLTPWLRRARTHWGLTAKEARRAHPGDTFIADPSWQWTHSVIVNASPEEVWPWLLQIGQGRGGLFRSQTLERLIGRPPKAGDIAQPEWPELGASVRLHPRQAPLPIVAAQPKHWFFAHTQLLSESAPAEAQPGQRASASWLFLVEPLSHGRSRIISRYRIKHGSSRAARLRFGAALLEPLSFVVDRQLLREVKLHSERAQHGYPIHWRSNSLGYQHPGV